MNRKIFIFILTIFFSLNIFIGNTYANVSFLDEVKKETAKAIGESVGEFLDEILNTKIVGLVNYNISEGRKNYGDFIDSLIDKSYSNYTKEKFDKDFGEIFNKLLNQQIKSLENGYITLKNTYIGVYNKNIIIKDMTPILSFHKTFCEKLIEEDDLIVKKKIFNVKVKFNQIKFSDSGFKDINTLNAFRDNILKYDNYLKRRDAVCNNDYHDNLKRMSEVLSYINTNKTAFNNKYGRSNLNKIINNYINDSLVK